MVFSAIARSKAATFDSARIAIASRSIVGHRDDFALAFLLSLFLSLIFLIRQYPTHAELPYRSYFTNSGSRAGRKVFLQFRAFKRPRVGVSRNLYSRESTDRRRRRRMLSGDTAVDPRAISAIGNARGSDGPRLIDFSRPASATMVITSRIIASGRII